jgi:hypothetical protein
MRQLRARHCYLCLVCNCAHVCVWLTFLQCASFNLGAASPVDVSSQGADYAFSDDAADSLTASCAPVVPGGLYLPTSATAATSAAGDMSALAGASAAGLWTVTVEDLAPGGAALLHVQPGCVTACTLTHASAHGAQMRAFSMTFCCGCAA